MKKAAKGHRKSQVALYEDFYGYAMSVGLRFSDTREEAQEIVHDSFIKAFGKLDTITNADSFKPWFRRIIVNTSIDFFRKKRLEIGQLDVVENEVADLNEDALSQMSAQEILDAIQQLTPGYRMVFTLYAIEGYKHDEIAKELGISVGASKSNLSKARQKLQKMLLDSGRKEVSNG
ncbi:RNA polymerase sigma factor [Reichenbachiella versicolor]|uniref:RNA polymerase sigma factor n=1 Tax=Reichenbachiella versicolor TaxID=1821036 RepID=UPI001FE436E8|nr:RNA polymerase sigma factor [Reichenbachiella versicolor]